MNLKARCFEGDGVLDFVKVELCQRASFVVRSWIEDIVEKSPDLVERCSRSVARNTTLQGVVEAPQIVGSKDVVGVGVGVEDPIDPLDTCPERLLAEIR